MLVEGGEVVQHKAKKRSSLQRKILTNGHLTMTIILLVTFFSYYYIFYNEFKQNFQYRLITIAQTAALLVDAEEHERLQRQKDEGTEEYRHIKKILQDFQKANPDIKYIYTMRKTDKEYIWQFVVDAQHEDSEDFSHLGDVYDVSSRAEMRQAFKGAIADKSFDEDQWGSFLSGYAPIKDSDGKSVAIVGVDIAADTLVQQERRMLAGAMVIFMVSMGLITYATRRTVNYFLIPINKIIEGINEIRHGNLEYRTRIDTNDEFAEIGEMLNSAAEMNIEYRRILEKDLLLTKEQRQKIFTVYRDVIYSVTQGKFNLLNDEEALPILDEGLLKEDLVVKAPEEVPVVRQQIIRFVREKEFPERQVMHIGLCVSEAITNAVKHAREGYIQLKEFDDRVRIIVRDHGPGMDFDKLPNMIFLEGFSTKISMGYGFSIIYKYADKIYLATSSKGTLLILDFIGISMKKDRELAC